MKMALLSRIRMKEIIDMNIYSFDLKVSSKIVGRGYAYYEDGHVTDFEQKSGHRYGATVVGTDMYIVEIKLDEQGNILYSYCDCPYDMGPICKHEVAVYFHLKDLLEEGSVEETAATQLVPHLKNVLSGLSKEELIEIVVRIAGDNQAVKNSLIKRYAPTNDRDLLQSCKIQIKSIVQKHQGREGVITYRNASDFTEELEEVLENIIESTTTMVALEVAGAVFEEALEAFQYTDDSDGDVGYLVDRSFDKIREIVQNRSKEDNEELLMDWISSQSENPELAGWDDFRIELLSICTEFADNVVLRSKLQGLLESKIVDQSDNWSHDYKNERILLLLYSLLETHGTQQEAMDFLHEHVSHSSFREKLIEMAMDSGEYETVVELALAGEKQDAEYRGLLTNWKTRRYKAYVGLGLVAEQKQLGYELLMAGDFEFYWDLKKIEVGKEQVFYDHLKDLFAGEQNYTNQHLYVQLIEAENDLSALLEYVQGHPSSIEKYMDRLIETYYDEVIGCFEQYVRNAAEQATNRNQYKTVCQTLKRFGKTAGRELELRVKSELANQYKRRPAFVDELGKL